MISFQLKAFGKNLKTNLTLSHLLIERKNLKYCNLKKTELLGKLQDNEK